MNDELYTLDVDVRPGPEEQDERLPGAEEVFPTPPTIDPTLPKRQVRVDWEELEAALENNSPDLHSFLHTLSGEVIRVFQTADNSSSRLAEIEASPDYVLIDPVSSREQYRWMEEFIEIVAEPGLKEKLNIAIDGKGAFRRFKDVLMAYPVERERWFQKRSAKLRILMTEWMERRNLEPLNPPPWEETTAETEERQHEESRLREQTPDLRVLAHELVDLVPPRELPLAVAFLEFLRGRRGQRRQRPPLG